MAFSAWKDRVTATPHRYKLTEVATDTYDFEAVPGAISEAGTPVNAENLDKLIQRDGDDIKDTVVAFTEAGARANIATGEKTATLFGKVKKYFTDLKAHSFVAPSTTQGTGTTSVPCDNLLTQSSFARVYREATEISGITYPVTIGALVKAIMDANIVNCYLCIGMNASTESKVEGLPMIGTEKQTYGTLTIITGSTSALRMRIEYNKEVGNDTTLMWIGSINRGTTPYTVTWKQVIDDSTAQTISAIKTYSVSPLVPTTPSGASAAVNKAYVTAPPDNITMTKAGPQYTLKNTDIAVGTVPTANKYTAFGFLDNSGNNCGYVRYGYTTAGTTELNFAINSHWAPNTRKAGIKFIHNKGAASDGTQDTIVFFPLENETHDLGSSTYKWKDIHFSGALKKNGVEVFPSPYDRVIRTQAEFDALIASATWLDAVSVAFVGAFTLSTANNGGVKIPATVKIIHGYNSAKITITNFAYNSSTGKGGLWYDTLPIAAGYEMRNMEVALTGTGDHARAFYQCINLYNCVGTGTGTVAANGIGFNYCYYMTNCVGTGAGPAGYGIATCDYVTNCAGTGTSATSGYGFYACNYVANCVGTGTGGTTTGCGFYDCDYVTNCVGTGTGGTTGTGFAACFYVTNCFGKGVDSTDASAGYGFSGIRHASNCKDNSSSTNMWTGTNYNIDLDTCVKTNVEADNTTLNT